MNSSVVFSFQNVNVVNMVYVKMVDMEVALASVTMDGLENSAIHLSKNNPYVILHVTP